MIIGVPKEIKDHEGRVAVTPAGVQAMVGAGHSVLLETNAGLDSGFPDSAYVAVGAEVVPSASDVYEQADMVLKVKAPLASEYDLLRSGQILFAYLHLAAEPDLTKVLLERKVTAVAYETVQGSNGFLPLLMPMSEVAGRMAPQIGAHLLELPQGGRGVLLGGVPGVPPAEVVVLGGGVVGTNAARVAAGLGARVTVIDIDLDRLRYLDDVFRSEIVTLASNEHNIAAAVEQADLLIGAVLIPGARTPSLVSEQMVAAMKPGAAIIDVAIDQGGSVATCDRVTTHEQPTFIRYGVVHYAVSNIPGAVARTSTLALTNATLPYALRLADLGFAPAVTTDQALARGVNTYEGYVTHQGVAAAHNLEYTPLSELAGLLQ